MASSTAAQTVPDSGNGTAEQVETRPQPTKSAWEHFCEYERERPGMVALWCFGLGFVLGWKLKLW